MSISPNLSLKRIQGNQDVSIEDSSNIFGMGGQVIFQPAPSGSLLRRTCNFSDLTSSPIGVNHCKMGSKKLISGTAQLDITKGVAVPDISNLLNEDANNNVDSVKVQKSRKKLANEKINSGENNKGKIAVKQVSEKPVLIVSEEAPKKNVAQKIFSTKKFAKIIDEVIKSDAVKGVESKANRKHKSKSRNKSKTESTQKGKKRTSTKKGKVSGEKVDEKEVPGILQLDRNNNNTAIEELLKEAAGILKRSSKSNVEIIPKRKSISTKNKNASKKNC